MKLQSNIPLILLLILLNFNAPLTAGLRILGLFPMNVKSHFVTCGELMRGLGERGHQVDVYSHFPLEGPVPNYTDFSLDGTLPALTNNLTYEVTNLLTATDAIKEWLKLGGMSACNLMELPIFQKLLRDPPKDPPYDLVIVEVSLANCYIAWGRHLNIPVIGVVAPLLPDWLHEHQGNPMNLAAESSPFASFAAPETFTQRVKNIYNHYHLKFSYNYHVREQDKYIEKFFGTDYPNAVELQKDLSLVLVNHQAALNGLKAFAPSVIPIGGLHIVDRNEPLPKKLQRWLDESENGFIYFSFGSMVRIETFPRFILKELFRSFKNIAPVRVLLKVAKPEELPFKCPANVITQPWLPQIQILKHKNIKAFVTHGGLMGTQEAVYFGVPMIGVPLISDEFFNVANCVQRGVAVEIDWLDITEERFTHLLQEVLNNPAYKMNAERLSKQFRDVPMSPMDTAAFWIGYISRHGKRALRLRIVDLPWWQVYHVDIFISFLPIFLLQFYVSRVIHR